MNKRYVAKLLAVLGVRSALLGREGQSKERERAPSRVVVHWVILFLLIAAAAFASDAKSEGILTCVEIGCGNEVPLHCFSWEEDDIVWTCWEGYREGGPAPF
ncbi:MAG: hypothetical protein OXH51_03525 [Gemmatimonadetes bacterium]|nr:hypothetical protein [Gemmatimonadota bacterium]MCY3610581.1 hypothetical protein [Gemmatimonadota bacterium]MCY3678576.1 hypothetical protein [Gemmatimonadota bacterium]MYA41419.1 hypothetical protein [Gemmatimonadota bacterium]MYE95494.1 hypothetical protein [Gemmatimonadota bacterium]